MPCGLGRLAAGQAGARTNNPLKVPRHGHEAPLDAHFVETAQRKLAESERRLDDVEHRLRRLLAQGLEVAAFGRLQPMGHSLNPRRIFRCGPLLRETPAKRGMMRLAARRHQCAVSAVSVVLPKARTNARDAPAPQGPAAGGDRGLTRFAKPMAPASCTRWEDFSRPSGARGSRTGCCGR